MNIDEHFDRVSRQNLKFQFEFEYCAPFWANQCSCGPYVDGSCFKIEKFMLSAMSRWYLGLVSMLRRSWFCVAWVVSRGVTVMSRSCFHNALLMSR